MTWELSRTKGVRKWVCWSMGAWVTAHAHQDVVHVGFDNHYVGEWPMRPLHARSELERWHRERLVNN